MVSKREAREVLGISDGRGIPVPLGDLTREQLIDRLQLRMLLDAGRVQGHRAEVKALENKLQSAIKAKRLANARADKWQKAHKEFLETFKGDTL